ncbi:XkdX family protein [Bacillus sp. FJAT-53060]|uniref:XkdX family protein n=1 Tax=Bacillus TaxID=1386 RepID=UPI001CFBA5B9|nr:XkdX family protein [Bacillus stratosphericus]
MNYWVMALYFKWVTPELVKQAVKLGDCSIADLKEGCKRRLLTLEQLQEIDSSFKAKE